MERKEAFTWTEEYSVSVQLFDEQHKVFFHIANNILDFLHADMEKTRKKNTMISLLKDLQSYAIYHLNSEEEYFNQFHYQDAAAHIAAHDSFRKTMERFMKNAEQESADIEKIGREMAEFTGNWLLKHILVVDKGYSQFFHEHGMQ